MTNEIKIASKVLVHETDKQHMVELKSFFEENNLVGLKAEHHSNIIETLKSNIDLGAIMLCEGSDDDGKIGLEIVPEIHAIRPELPIFLR